MRVLIQRVERASVTVDTVIAGSIQQGILVFVGIGQHDTHQELEWMAHKILNLRIFNDNEGKMNISVLDIHGSLLIVSQFTLYADVQKGFRPGYSQAAEPEAAKTMYENFVNIIRSKTSLNIQTGIFGAMMDVELINDGPVTIWLEKEPKIVV